MLKTVVLLNIFVGCYFLS